MGQGGYDWGGFYDVDPLPPNPTVPPRTPSPESFDALAESAFDWPAFYQIDPLDGNPPLSPSTFGRLLMQEPDAAHARQLLGVGPGTEDVPVIEHAGLRAIDTFDTVVESVIQHMARFTGGVWIGSDWLLIAGTAADDDDTIIRPHDYTPGTNEKIWVKTVGF